MNNFGPQLFLSSTQSTVFVLVVKPVANNFSLACGGESRLNARAHIKGPAALLQFFISPPVSLLFPPTVWL